MSRSRSVVFFLSYFLYFFAFWMVLVYLPVIFKSHDFTDQQIGFAIGLNSLSSILLVLPFGIFSDYFSPKRTLTLGAVCFSGYFLLLIILKDFYSICAALILGGVGAAAIRVILMSLYLKLIDRTGRGKKVAFLHFGGYLGFGSGPLLGGYLYETFGATLMIKAAFVLSIMIVLLTLLLEDAPPVVFSFKDYKKDIKEPNALFLMAVVFVLGTHFGAEQTSISLLMKDVIGLDKKEIGFVFFALGVWMAILVPFAGILMDKKHRIFFLLLLGLLISSCFQFMTPFTSTLYGLLIIRMIHTMGDTLAILESDVLTAHFFPAARLGGNSGLIFCVRTVAIFVFAAFSGWLNQIWGYKMPFFINGIMVFGFSLIAFLYIRRAFRESEIE
ncbi:MAG: MFS transporter [Deltaproteobacteria bacterium]|nr:MFS transporter [Deltaproteobacteria bacterium]MBW2019090.1 MFS transporter [Deltaproteobacteria bacterium]MBW2073519.1 MFS transporter [Deltaproteobacteria bacterium]